MENKDETTNFIPPLSMAWVSEIIQKVSPSTVIIMFGLEAWGAILRESKDEEGYFKVSIRRLGGFFGYSKSTCSKAMSELVDNNYIQKINPKGKNTRVKILKTGKVSKNKTLSIKDKPTIEGGEIFDNSRVGNTDVLSIKRGSYE